MSTAGILMIGVGLAGLVALFTGNLDRALERLAGAPATDAPRAWFDPGAAGKDPAPTGVGGGSSSAGVQAARAAHAAGFRAEALVTALAVARGESGWRADAVGDVALANATWGPSIGLWQIRSLRAETGTGGHRDASRLRDPGHNARAAWSISSGGTNWRPWTVYQSGAYRAHVGAARSAVAAAGLAAGRPEVL